MSETSFIYDYGTEASRVRGVYLPVAFTVDARTTTAVIRVDCASIYCVLERSWAVRFGLMWEDGQMITIGTATGHFQAYLHVIELQIDQFRWEVPVAIAEFESVPGVVPREVLGLIGFFDRFRVTIDDLDKQIIVEPRF